MNDFKPTYSRRPKSQLVWISARQLSLIAKSFLIQTLSEIQTKMFWFWTDFNVWNPNELSKPNENHSVLVHRNAQGPNVRNLNLLKSEHTKVRISGFQISDIHCKTFFNDGTYLLSTVILYTVSVWNANLSEIRTIVSSDFRHLLGSDFRHFTRVWNLILEVQISDTLKSVWKSSFKLGYNILHMHIFFTSLDRLI